MDSVYQKWLTILEMKNNALTTDDYCVESNRFEGAITSIQLKHIG
jgi:hypothetical protein